MNGSSQVIRIEDLGGGFRRLHLSCGHSLKRRCRRTKGISQVGDFVSCGPCLNRSPLAEVGINGKQALGGTKGRPADVPPCHCHLGPGRWGR